MRVRGPQFILRGMGIRRVRGESGAVFEVDDSMLGDDASVERGYRESNALPRASAITPPAPARASDRSGAAPLVVLLYVAVVFVIALLRS